MAVGVAAEVKSRLQVADIVGETVQLRKAGTTFKGLCPFHGEKTPSFVVTPARESWKCFGCGLGGDIFSFVMQRDGVSFPEALKALAAKAPTEVTLVLTTYTLPAAKAEAFGKFLSEHVKASVLEIKVENDKLTVTTTPGAQRAISEFVGLILDPGARRPVFTAPAAR